jgi:hypothetical protein
MHLYRPALGSPSLLYNGYRVFPRGVENGRGVTLTPHPFQCRGLKQSRAISLFSLRAFVTCKRVKPTYIASKNYNNKHKNMTDIKSYAIVINFAVLKIRVEFRGTEFFPFTAT